MFVVGKLYQIKQFHWLLSSDKFIGSGPYNLEAAQYRFDYYNRQLLDIKIINLIPETIFALLEIDKNMVDFKDYLKLVTTNGDIGWICVNHAHERYFQELKQE